MSALRGAVVAVGDELVRGDVVNANAAWLGAALASVGVDVLASSAVGDHVGRLVTALGRALEDADVVVVCGGLGPTSDDRTRQALAALGSAPLERHPEVAAQLRARFAAGGSRVPEQVLAQADAPRGARVLDNPAGTAPGLQMEIAGRTLYALPGPPHELSALCRRHLLPALAARTQARLSSRTLSCAGVGEPEVAERVQASIEPPEGVELGYLAADGITRVSLRTWGDSAVLDPLVTAARAALGQDVFGEGQQGLPAVLAEMLAARGQTVAIAESLTGGLLGAALSTTPGSSTSFLGGVVAYATDLKHRFGGVSEAVLAEHGAVSSATAAALAEAVRDSSGAYWGLSTTGVAGPATQEGKPVGTVHVGLAGPASTRVNLLRLPGSRERVRTLAVTAALDQLRRALLAESTP